MDSRHIGFSVLSPLSLCCCHFLWADRFVHGGPRAAGDAWLTCSLGCWGGRECHYTLGFLRVTQAHTDKDTDGGSKAWQTLNTHSRSHARGNAHDGSIWTRVMFWHVMIGCHSYWFAAHLRAGFHCGSLHAEWVWMHTRRHHFPTSFHFELEWQQLLASWS